MKEGDAWNWIPANCWLLCGFWGWNLDPQNQDPIAEANTPTDRRYPLFNEQQVVGGTKVLVSTDY